MHIGQTLILGFEGTCFAHKDIQALSELILKGQVGGLIFFNHNIETPDQLKRLTKHFKNIPAPYPLLFALDEEGGAVQRLKGPGFKDFLSAKEVASRYTPQEAYFYYKGLAQNLKDFGFNLNLAPVVDLDPLHGEPNEILGGRGRTFGSNSTTVTQYAQAHIQAHNEVGVYTALKHFPGHGRAQGDTHKKTVDVSTTWTEEEIEPYGQLVDSGAMVMLAHIIHSSLTEGVPGPFSSHLIEGVLRRGLGFKGLVITDDLFMQGACLGSLGASGLKALESGSDFLIYSYHPVLRSMMEGVVPTYGDLLVQLEAAQFQNSLVSSQVKKALTRIQEVKASLSKKESNT